MTVDALLQAAKRIDPTVSWARITVGEDVWRKPYVSVTLFAEERIGAGGCTLNEPERGEGTAETFDLAVKDALEQLKERKR